MLVVFIDATMPMPELINGKVENVPRTNKTRKSLLLIMCAVLLKIATFLWRFLILHSGHINLFLETVTIKFGDRGPRAEKNKNPTLNNKTQITKTINQKALRDRCKCFN